MENKQNNTNKYKRIKSSTFTRNKLLNTNNSAKYSYYLSKLNSTKESFFNNKTFKNEKLFSLLDINDKLTNYKSNSLPFQYIRICPEKFATFYKKLNSFSKDKNILKDKNISFSKELNKSMTNRNMSYISPKNKTNNINIPKSEMKYSKIYIKNEQMDYRKINTKTPLFSPNKKVERKRQDIYMPKGYEKYEELVKNNILFFKRLKANTKFPSFNSKEVKLRHYNSDIFCYKTPKPSTQIIYDNSNNKKRNNNSNNNIRFNKEVNICQSDEQFLFKNRNQKNYHTSKESNSYWESPILKNTINTCSSKKYNILIPSIKSENITRDEVYKKFNELNIKYFNRQGIIAKYLNLTNKNSNNSIKEYIKSYKENPNCFRREKEYCSFFGDLYSNYKNLCSPPFRK